MEPPTKPTVHACPLLHFYYNQAMNSTGKAPPLKKSQNNSKDASSAANMLNSFSHEDNINLFPSRTGNLKSGQKVWSPPLAEFGLSKSRKVQKVLFQKELGNENLEIVARWVSLFWATPLGCWWSRRRIGNPPIVCVRVLRIWRSVFYHCVCCVGVLSGRIVCVSPVYCTVYLCVGVLSVCMRPGERSLNTSS